MKTFGFCKIETLRHDMAKGSLLILGEESRSKHIHLRVGIFVEVKDNLDTTELLNELDIPTKSPTASYQIRPKVVHVNSKGFYIKEKTGVSYLSEDDVFHMNGLFKYEII